MRSIRKTTKTSKTRIFFQKMTYPKYRKMKLSPKMRNLMTPDTEMLYIMFKKALY
jgi:hypothetical protein